MRVSGAETTHRGIELTASWRLSEIWSLRGNGSYARHRYDSDMDGVPNHYDTDADNDTLTAQLVSDVDNGTLSLEDDGSFRLVLPFGPSYQLRLVPPPLAAAGARVSAVHPGGLRQ